MKIKISDLAAQQLAKFTSYYASHFSLQAAINLTDSFIWDTRMNPKTLKARLSRRKKY